MNAEVIAFLFGLLTGCVVTFAIFYVYIERALKNIYQDLRATKRPPP